MLYVLAVFGLAVVVLLAKFLIYVNKEVERQMRNHEEDLSWYGPENTDDN